MPERALLDERSLLKDARDEGREKGFADGIAKGEQRGRDDALRQTAANLIQAIAAVTGLRVDEIAALRHDI